MSVVLYLEIMMSLNDVFSWQALVPRQQYQENSEKSVTSENTAVIMCHVMWILNGFTISICPYINIYMIDRSVSGLKSIYGILKSGSFPTAQIYDLLLVRVRVSVYVSDVIERRFKKWP